MPINADGREVMFTKEENYEHWAQEHSYRNAMKNPIIWVGTQILLWLVIVPLLLVAANGPMLCMPFAPFVFILVKLARLNPKLGTVCAMLLILCSMFALLGMVQYTGKFDFTVLAKW